MNNWQIAVGRLLTHKTCKQLNFSGRCVKEFFLKISGKIQIIFENPWKTAKIRFWNRLRVCMTPTHYIYLKNNSQNSNHIRKSMENGQNHILSPPTHFWWRPHILIFHFKLFKIDSQIINYEKICIKLHFDQFHHSTCVGCVAKPTHSEFPNFWFASDLNLEYEYPKVSFCLDHGKSKSLRLKNWYSSERECDFHTQNISLSKMTFRFIIYTHQTILTQNTDQKFDHVSECGKLFCIFPFTFYKL